MNPFYKQGFLLPIASLNKVKVVSLGEWSLPDEFRNRYGSQLISGALFQNRLLEFMETNRASFNEVQEGLEPIEVFNACLQDEGNAGEAKRIVEKFARGLAYLLLTLKTGGEENRSAREDWNEEHWQYWNQIERIFLCGGLTYDCIGKTLIGYMNNLFGAIRFVPYKVELADHGPVLPMIGANRMMAKNTEAQLVFDFGHSFVKTGLFVNGELVQVNRTKAMFVNQEQDFVRESAEQLHSFILDTVLGQYKELSKIRLDKTIGMVFANYVRDSGAMYTGRGGYAKLGFLAKRYGDFLSGELSKGLCADISVTMFHDGTAGACAVKEYPKAAVISLGTGLGIGFTDFGL